MAAKNEKIQKKNEYPKFRILFPGSLIGGWLMPLGASISH